MKSQASGLATLSKRDSYIGAFFPVSLAIFLRTPCFFRAAASGCSIIGAFHPELNQIQIWRGQLLLATVFLMHCIF